MRSFIKQTAFTFTFLTCFTAHADLEQHTLYSPSIADNFIGTNANRTVSVYLPKGYEKSQKNYPVLYFLGAYNWDSKFANSFETIFKNFENDTAPLDFIVVMIDGDTPLRGSFYVNSKAHGGFSDLVVKEVVPWVNKKYRVKKTNKNTAIAGFSMGGTGALRFAAKYPDIFGHVYALSPGIMDQNGFKNSYLGNATAIAKYEQFRQKLTKTSKHHELMKKEFSSFQGMELWQNGEDNSNAAFVMAYGGAFTGNPSEAFGPHFSTDKSLTSKWREGFGGIIDLYTSPNILAQLNSVKIEVGNKDEYQWITDGNSYLKKLSEEQNSIVNVTLFDGNHTNKVRQQISNSMLPHFQKLL